MNICHAWGLSDRNFSTSLQLQTPYEYALKRRFSNSIEAMHMHDTCLHVRFALNVSVRLNEEIS
jgi:hypothetical protein